MQRAAKALTQNGEAGDAHIARQIGPVRSYHAGNRSRNAFGHKVKAAQPGARLIAAQRQGDGAILGQQSVQQRHAGRQCLAVQRARDIDEPGQQVAGSGQIEPHRPVQVAPSQQRQSRQITNHTLRRAGQGQTLGNIVDGAGGRQGETRALQAKITDRQGAARSPVDLGLTCQRRTQRLRQPRIGHGQTRGIKVELPVKPRAFAIAGNVTRASKLHGFRVKPRVIQPLQPGVALPTVPRGTVIIQRQSARIEPCFAVRGQRQHHRTLGQAKGPAQPKGQRHQIGIKTQAAIQRQGLRRHAKLGQVHSAIGQPLALGVQRDIGAKETGILRQENRGRIARQIGDKAPAFGRGGQLNLSGQPCDIIGFQADIG